MGLLDGLVGALSGGKGIDYSTVLQWIEQQGGLQAILDKFRQGNLSDVVASWIGTGENQSINGEQVEQALSSDAIAQLAGKLGMDPAQASALIAQYLPMITDKLSPNGQEPQNGDLLSAGMDLLKGKLFG
ncbi:YidB family protein [Serratia sp. L9]|uniref:YidB family protein n=1 Tax=Serratia sp. L9 TaxID=3423946 RepID=UPI003D678FE1